MNTDKINALITKKIARQAILSDRKEQLETLRKELFSSKIGRFFGKMYYYIKRYVTLVLGVFAFILAITLFVYPDLVFGEAEKEDLLMKYKADYYEIAGKTIDDSVRNFENNGVRNAPNATTDLVRTINDSIVKTMGDEVKISNKYMAFGLILLGFLLLYISSLTKSIHARNLKITQAEVLAKEVIEDYKLTIAEEAEELRLFREIANPKVTDVIPPEAK